MPNDQRSDTDTYTGVLSETISANYKGRSRVRLVRFIMDDATRYAVETTWGAAHGPTVQDGYHPYGRPYVVNLRTAHEAITEYKAAITAHCTAPNIGPY